MMSYLAGFSLTAQLRLQVDFSRLEPCIEPAALDKLLLQIHDLYRVSMS